jgi:hypothetical protein
LFKIFSDYTIKYETYGGLVFGEELQDDNYSFLDKTHEPKDLRKEGYYIEGYYTDAEFKNRYEFGKSIWKSRTLHVNWQPGVAVQLFFAEGEDDADRNQAEKTGFSEATLKLLYEQYVKAGTTYTLPLVYNHVEGNKHFNEQLLWYTNEDLTGDPIMTKDFEMSDNIKLYGVWYDTSPSKFDITEDGTLIRYLGNCYNIMLPKSVKRFKSISPSAFISGIWNTSNVADGSNFSVFDKVYSNLKRVYVNAECEELNDCAFRNCTALERVHFSGNIIETVGQYAFTNCKELNYITLPTSVKNIGRRAFYQSGIKTVNNLDNVEFIDEGAFMDCQEIMTITLKNVRQIQKLAFAGCINLKSVNIITPLVVESNMVNTETSDDGIICWSQNCKIYVPEVLLDLYKQNSQWSRYSDKILSIDG